MNTLSTCVAIVIILALLAMLFWWFVYGDEHYPLDGPDEYEDLARGCAKADGVDFEPEDVRRNPMHLTDDEFLNDWPVKPARKT